jgi:hypothetical protein
MSKRATDFIASFPREARGTRLGIACKNVATIMSCMLSHFLHTAAASQSISDCASRASSEDYAVSHTPIAPELSYHCAVDL